MVRGGCVCGLFINTLECCVTLFFLPASWPVSGLGLPEFSGVTMNADPLKPVGCLPENKL